MPEGPSILILKEKLISFEGKKIVKASGNAKIDLSRLEGQKIIALESWGKHFLICFKGFFIRIHLLMFGTYRINERTKAKPRLRLLFTKGEINFYTCHILLLEGSPEDIYDMESDILSKTWNPTKAIAKLKRQVKDGQAPNISDALLDQEIFSGVGNIIKNETLFLARVHPNSSVDAIPLKKLRELVKHAEAYTWNFYKWKKENVLSRHFQVYERKVCPRCKIPLIKENTGKGKRLTNYCDNCQVLYQK